VLRRPRLSIRGLTKGRSTWTAYCHGTSAANVANAPSPANRALAGFASWILIGLIGIALCAAGARYQLTRPRTGSFASAKAPNGGFNASAHTKREKRFFGGTREYFEFFISKFDPAKQQFDRNEPWAYPPQRTIILDRIDGVAFPFERGVKACKVEWAADASEVAFDLDGAKVSISTKDL